MFSLFVYKKFFQSRFLTLSNILIIIGVPAASRMGGNKYFVRWDRKKSGGRFFECKVTSRGYYANVLSYDVRYTVKFHKSQVFKMGCPLNVGDDVIAYWHRHDRFAYAGNVNSKIEVEISNNILVGLSMYGFHG